MKTSFGIFLLAIFVVGVLAAPAPVTDEKDGESRSKRGLSPSEGIGMAKTGAQMGCQVVGEGIKTGTDHAKGAPGGGVFSDSVGAGKNACTEEAGAIGDAAEDVASKAGWTRKMKTINDHNK
ncbi:hypothetical protein L9F63_008312 [Diploptera punctata]|uniref:Uncharacterized protein n=1 Tax=Diploptera punctata TaxID=6984 RepID=A0AAD7Z5Y8_DIPPU|nr:hypothetical protein L9F63_008312 [Diploptera punctata]